MRQMEADHQRQLSDISQELMQFESSLRVKEKQIGNMLSDKDQVDLSLKSRVNENKDSVLGNFEATETHQKAPSKAGLI